MVTNISRTGKVTDSNKPLGLANEYYFKKSVAGAIEQASLNTLDVWISGTLAAGDYMLGFLPADAELVAVRIKAGTAGQNGTATITVKVAGSGIHTARAIDATTTLTPTLTTTTGSAGDVVLATYAEDTGTEAANVLIQLSYRLISDKYNDRT